MIFDKAEHKDILLQMMIKATWPGHLLDIGVELRKAIENGVIKSPDRVNADNSKTIEE